MKRREFVVGLAGLAAAASSRAQEFRFPAKGRVPAGYPSGYAATIAAAEEEGRVVVHSSTDIAIAKPLVEDFQALYPRIEVQYLDMNTNDLHNGYLADLLGSPTTADVLWSSAMDSQFRLAMAGQALHYASPELATLPGWAVWTDVAFGTTFEPIAIVYNKRLLADNEVPRTHADLARLLADKRFAGKVVTYDVDRSGLGFLLATQDERASTDFWTLVKALGAAGARLVPTTDAMLKRVTRGDDLIGYNALGSYAQIEAQREPSLGFAYLSDYTLVVTRVMLIGLKAANPNAARLWVDYLLSRRGQAVLAKQAGLPALRQDLEAVTSTATLANTLAGSAHPIPLTPEEIATHSDSAKRAAFLKRWQQAISGKP
jgi:iron(III) transport system substrate-binding protein